MEEGHPKPSDGVVYIALAGRYLNREIAARIQALGEETSTAAQA
jgi:hypothetical protein